MARTVLTVTDVTRSGVVQPAQQALDAVNNNSIPANDGRIILEVQNSGASTYTLTAEIPGTVDGVAAANLGKQISLTAGQFQLFGPFPPAIYNQPDGSVSLDPQNAALKVRVYHLP